jgi:alginate O-acetyltransferase complex protein AlgI
VFYRPYQKKIHKALGIEKTKFLKTWQIFVTFNLVCLAWVFFRAREPFYVLMHCFEKIHVENIKEYLFINGTDEFLLLIISFVIFLLVLLFIERDEYKKYFLKSRMLRNISYSLFVVIIIIMSVGSGYDYIYLKF